MAKRGFTLSEMLVVMVILGIVTAATIPMFTMKKKMKDFEVSSLTCARTQLAADLNSAACVAAVSKAQYGQEKAINTLSFLVNNGTSAAEKTAASTILKEACDNGGNKACEYFVSSCQKDSTLCDTGGLYDLRSYLELMPETNDFSKFLIYDQAKALYDSNNTNITTAVDNCCCPLINMACAIKGQTECPWIRHYGGANWDSGYSIAISGNYIYITGIESSDNILGGANKIFVMKLNKSDGTSVWKKYYGGIIDDQGYSIAVSGGYIYVAGHEWSDSVGGYDILVMRLDESTGTAVWKKHYGGIKSDYGESIVISGGYIYVSGHELSDTAGFYDACVMKLDASNGTVVWKKRYGGGSIEYACSLVVSGGYIYVTGHESSVTAGNADIYVMKLNTSDGISVWKKRYGGAGEDLGYSIAVSGDYVYVTGYETSDTAGDADIYVMKLNTSDGTSVWKKRYGGTLFDMGYSIAVSGDYLYITGYELSDVAGTYDALVMKLNTSDGSSIWTRHYGGANEEYAWSIAVSGDYLYVTGNEVSDSSAGSEDIFVMKLSTDQTSNMGADWTADSVPMGAGWTADGVALAAGWTADVTIGALWTANGAAIKTPTVAFDSPWTTGATQTTGGTGVPMGANWTMDDVLIRKTTDGSNYWIVGLAKDGVPE